MEIKNARYSSPTTIDLEINHPQYGWISFTASATDVEAHGRELYSRALLGEFGALGAWVEPPPYLPSADENKRKAEEILNSTDWVNQPDVYNTDATPHLKNREEFLSYRATIRLIAITPISGSLTWPDKPTPIWSK